MSDSGSIDKKLKKKQKKRKQLEEAAASGAAGSAAADGAPDPSSGTAGSSYKKKLKKQRKAEAAAAASGLANSSASASNITRNDTDADAAGSGLDKAARKALKKAKRQAEAAAASAATPATSGEVTDAAGPSGLSKKERKRLAAAAAAATDTFANIAASAAEPNGSADQPKKKKKKSKGSSERAGSEAAMDNKSAGGSITKKAKSSGVQSRPMAEVGDVQLATSSKPIVRDIYEEHPAVASQSAADVAKVRDERSINVEGSDLKPILAFQHSGFSSQLLQSTASFAQPSPIQAECWAPACAGRDVIGIAATGSGKTLAFGLPALAHARAQIDAGVADGRTPSILVIAPTRELAMQIAGVLEAAGKPCRLNTLCVYGGVPKYPQAKTLRQGVNVLVATPGRLEDLMNDGAARLHQVTFLVLDEADRMLDLGFEPHIRAICKQTRADRQTLMFSATWPPAIQKLASEFLSNPVKVTIGSADLSASHSVSQVVEVIDPRAREKRLQELLQQYHGARKRQNRVIIFVLYKKEAVRVEQQLNRSGWKAVAVHGDASQQQRTAAVDSFKAGDMKLLIATDVAARGLDIPDVEVVINYSFPLTTEDYVHRIGRTGRAGKTGAAHTFFSGETDKPRAGELINVLREAGQPVPEELLKFGTTVKKKESKLYGAHFKDVDFSQKSTKVTFGDSDED